MLRSLEMAPRYGYNRLTDPVYPRLPSLLQAFKEVGFLLKSSDSIVIPVTQPQAVGPGHESHMGAVDSRAVSTSVVPPVAVAHLVQPQGVP